MILAAWRPVLPDHTDDVQVIPGDPLTRTTVSSAHDVRMQATRSIQVPYWCALLDLLPVMSLIMSPRAWHERLFDAG